MKHGADYCANATKPALVRRKPWGQNKQTPTFFIAYLQAVFLVESELCAALLQMLLCEGRMRMQILMSEWLFARSRIR